MEKLEAAVKKHLVDYKANHLKQGPGGNLGCSFVIATLSDEVVEHPQRACHLDLMNLAGQGTVKDVYTSLSVSKPEHLDACNRWIDWIFSDKSPWALAAVGATVVRDEEGVPLYAKVVTADDPNVAAPLFYNLIHQTRAPYEQPAMLALWCHLMDEHGYDPIKALVYAYRFDLVDASNDIVKIGYRCHHFISLNKVIDLKRMREADPVLSSIDSSSFNTTLLEGVNKMWETGTYTSAPRVKYHLSTRTSANGTKCVNPVFGKLNRYLTGSAPPKNLCLKSLIKNYLEPIYAGQN